ncbi:MAG TPA: alpha/beta hydrolase [Candidatus Dormibacteraeota bacterium]
MTASQHMVQANGLRFRVLADGPSDGDLVVLLHGFPEGAESWTRQIDAIAKAGGLAVAPDMRGYGKTDAPPAVDDYRLEVLVEDTMHIVKAFGRDRAHVAGHDWGAMVAWFFAGAHPDMTQTLTVLSVGHPAALGHAVVTDDDQKARSEYIRLFLMEGKAERVLADDEFRRLRAMFGGKLPRAVVDDFVRSLSRPGRLTAGLNYYRANLSQEHWWAGLQSDLKIAIPTVLLWGDQDPALGREQAEKSADRVDADFRLEVLAGAGHWLQFERPAEVARSLTGVLSK